MRLLPSMSARFFATPNVSRTSNKSAFECQNRSERGAKMLLKAENAPSRAKCVRALSENALGEPWECSRSVKTRWGSRGNAPEGRKCLGEAVGALPKVENALGKPWECSRSVKTLWGRLGNTPEGRKRLGQAVGVLPKRENALGRSRESSRRSKMPRAGRGSAPIA